MLCSSDIISDRVYTGICFCFDQYLSQQTEPLLFFLTLESHSFRVLMLMNDTSPLAPVITPSCSQRTIRSMSSPSFHLRYLQSRTVLLISVVLQLFIQIMSFNEKRNMYRIYIIKSHQWARSNNVPICNRSNLIFIHVIFHKWVWIGKCVFFFPL